MIGLAQVLDGDVDQPGAQRFLLLVRLSVVLHGFSPSEIDDEPLVDSGYLARCGIARERNDTGLETALVAVRPVHVSEFHVGGRRAAPRARQNTLDLRRRGF